MKLPFLQKSVDLLQKNTDISKIKRAFVLKGIFSETKFLFVLTCKIEISGLILASLKQGAQPQNEPPKKPTQIGVSLFDFMQAFSYFLINAIFFSLGNRTPCFVLPKQVFF